MLASLSSGGAQRTERNNDSASPSLKRPSRPPREEVQVLRQRLGELAKDINFADMSSVHQARNNVVCEVLLWEFGDNFRNDSKFLPMVAALERTLDSVPSFQQRFLDLMTELRKA